MGGRGASTRESAGGYQDPVNVEDGDCRRSDMELDSNITGLEGRYPRAVTTSWGASETVL